MIRIIGPIFLLGAAFISFSQTKNSPKVTVSTPPSVQNQTNSEHNTSPPSKPKKIFIALGDSLTEGYQLSSQEAYPHLLEARLNKEFPRYKTQVINAGISGSTTSSGVNRLKKYLRLKPHVVFISLGSNDGLRGTPIDTIKKNLQNMIDLARSNNILVILAGLKIPMNYGEEYTEAFERIFKSLAQKNNVTYIPFLLEGVAGNPDLNLPDLIHPNGKGHKVMTETIYPYFRKFYN
ncbi:MAG: arylesterase [Bdellovibrionales bacterium]|nr:arylesterase [Bdellovibrionales bacterium]